MRSIFSMLLTLYFFALLTSGCSTIPEENKVPIKIIEAEASTALEIKSGTTVGSSFTLRRNVLAAGTG